MEQVLQMLDLVSAEAGQVANSDVVVGDPIEVGDTTVVPLCRVSLGFGAGGGQGEGEPPKGKRHGSGRGTGGGGGGGGKVRPVGVIVLGPDGVEVHPIPDRRGIVDRVFDRVPEVIDLVKDLKD